MEKLLVIDMNVTKNSPAGSCVLYQIQILSSYFDVILISSSFDSINTNIYKHIKVNVNYKYCPLFLKYWLFTLGAFVSYGIYRVNNSRPKYIQTTQGLFFFPDISYAHFCHKAYLNKYWQDLKSGTIKKVFRYFNHYSNSIFESISFRNARLIIVPSNGLKNELLSTYEFLKNKPIIVISNPINCSYFKCNNSFNRKGFRLLHGISDCDFVILFSALGDFSRKGLGLLIEAVALIGNDNIKILVVGGNKIEISEYSAIAKDFNVSNNVIFTGFVEDVRSFFWSSDLFSLPSKYETFSLVCFQAAASGLPILVTKLYGVEDYLIDGYNGWMVERDVHAISDAIRNIYNSRTSLSDMKSDIQTSIIKFGFDKLKDNWINLFESL